MGVGEERRREEGTTVPARRGGAATGGYPELLLPGSGLGCRCWLARMTVTAAVYVAAAAAVGGSLLAPEHVAGAHLGRGRGRLLARRQSLLAGESRLHPPREPLIAPGRDPPSATAPARRSPAM